MKGSKESLVVCDNMAFIINVKSRTIVTAMDRDSMKENVFTQIDSAVILS
jgi:flagellar operon protein